MTDVTHTHLSQQIAEKYNGEVIARNEYYSPDPTGARTGNGVGPQLSDTIERVALDAEEAISKVIDTPPATLPSLIFFSRILRREKLLFRWRPFKKS